MPFSQELKIEAYIRGFKCAEVPIKYRTRAGDAKLNTFKDGTKVMFQIFHKKLSTLFVKKYYRAGRKIDEQSASSRGSSNMKILIVTHYFEPHIGGIEIVAYNQAKELVKKGHEVTIVTSKLNREKAVEQKEGIRNRTGARLEFV